MATLVPNDAASPRVTYWTGTWDADKEAISKEINALRVGTRRRAPVVAFAPGQSTRILADQRVLRLSHRRWVLLRGVATLLEPVGDVTHVFGGAESWHLLRALGRRPTVLTAVVRSKPSEALPPIRLARVVVEADELVDEWIRLGVPRERITIVYPGIDLRRYAPAAAPRGDRFSLLFASTPADPGEIDARGIPLLIELARLRPDIDIVVPWRAWGDVAGAKAALRALAPPQNFAVRHEQHVDMREYFAAVHATVVCFGATAGKMLPNFVLEGLAAGRPCVATRESGVSGLIEKFGAGVSAERNVAGLAAAVDRVRAEWSGHAARARQLAERSFDVRQFVASYDRIYRDIRTAS